VGRQFVHGMNDDQQEREQRSADSKSAVFSTPFHTWRHLTGLETESLSIDFREIDSHQKRWLDLRRRRERATPDIYEAFLEKIYRHWAIETGIIEGLYDIDRGTTEALVEYGLSIDLIPSAGPDKSPHDVLKVLQDHQDAAKFVTDSIRRQRPLSKFYIKELHQLLLRNQKYYFAYDPITKRRIELELHHGAFKLAPNSPKRHDGRIHEYCPPEHVESELDNFIKFYDEYDSNASRFHPLSVAAWLHHRFTQIHPFEDGNGRVARALLTWHLARDDYLPVVISRDHKDEYIDALEIADAGNLNTFVKFIVGLERQIIVKALGEESTVPTTQVFTQVLNQVSRLAAQRLESEQVELRTVNNVASKLRDSTNEYLEERGDEIQKQLEATGLAIKCVSEWGGPDNEKEHWYRYQITETAKKLGYWVNFNENKYLVRLSINPEYGSTVPRMIFVISLHHVGRQLTGIMAANAFVQIDRATEGEDGESAEAISTDLKTCSPESFTFTADYNEKTEANAFNEWIEVALSTALSYWGQYLS